MIRIPYDPSRKEEIAQNIAKYLHLGYVFAIPTDTSYGLAADATNLTAVQKIFNIKRRPHTKPLSIFLDSIDSINKFVVVDDLAEKIIKILPERLTIIFKAKPSGLVKDFIVYKNTIGIRIPPSKLPRLIVKFLKRPITATSANIHGAPPIYDSKYLYKLDIDGFIDSGTLPQRPVSTIIDISSGHKIVVKRLGALDLNELKRKLSRINVLDKYPLVVEH